MIVGAYLATHKNPMFARLAMLQLAQQTYLPHVIAIHESGHTESYKWAWKDIEQDLTTFHGVKVLYAYTPANPGHPIYQAVPLKRLFDEGCEVFFKIDHDDLYSIRHVASGLRNLEGYDAVVKAKHGFLIQPSGADYRYIPATSFFDVPMKGHAGSVCFTRHVAAEYLWEMELNQGREDDLTLSRVLKDKYAVNYVFDDPTTVYVSHGGNTSTKEWASWEVLRQQGDSSAPQTPYVNGAKSISAHPNFNTGLPTALKAIQQP